MPVTLTPVAVFLLLLIGSGVVLMWEARTSRFVPRSRATWAVRTGVFFVASVVGAALLVRTAPAAPLLAMTLAPVTALSFYRFVSLSGRGRMNWALSLVLAFVVYLGVMGGLRVLPDRLDERSFVDQIFLPDVRTGGGSIDPATRRSSRA